MPRTSSTAAKRAKPAAKAKATARASAGERPARQKEPSLAVLKGQVLTLAKVSSTQELKRANVDLRHLDFRLKASWRSALGVLQQAAVAMDEWDRNPPEEYKELFAEIDQAAAAYSASIEQGLKLSSQLRDAADDLEAVAGELQQEAEELKTIKQASRKQRRARSLN
jgi:hypothetical protein